MFINIHSHRKPQTKDEYVIRNAFETKLNHVDALRYAVSTGIHPWLINKDNSEAFQTIEANLVLSNVIAIGECGLDRIRGPELELQMDVLMRHIELANHFKKPLILHLVKTYSDILSIAGFIKTPWIIHGFKGNLVEAQNLISKGAKLSFGPSILQTPELQNVFKFLPIEKIYLETDTKPILISKIYQFASSLLGVTIDNLKELIQTNFERDFSVVLSKL
jgi:TatD DNase family protein